MIAPVALFVFNRPEHTKKTIESLAKNELASDTDLHVFSDGPNTPDDELKTAAVRKVLKTVSGFKQVRIIERNTNLGLAQSIISGVTEIVEKYGRIIVLEDDLVTSPWFLTYMNEALDRYVGDEKVMHVAGYMYPIDPTGLPETFFYRATSCWGWATWKRAWDRFEPSVDDLALAFDATAKHLLNIDGAYDFWSHLELNQQGEMKTWAIRWYASVFLHGGLSLHPSVSLVENIGHDGSGIHCSRSDAYRVRLRGDRIIEFATMIEEDPLALSRIRRFLRQREPLPVRVMSKMRRIFHIWR